jgi:Tol biopolymer transport system component
MLTSGTFLGAYEVIDLLGAGGMGDVYRARDPRLGREVALKVLPAAFSTDADRVRRFEQEARAAAALNHPNILVVYDIGNHEHAPYIVSELLAGVTLQERLHGGALPVRKAIELSIQIARGLAAAHDKGIVHRDLKPANLLVTHAGVVKILDFGLAKLTEVAPGVSEACVATREHDTKPGVVMGTVGYMAPEQVRGLHADHRADIFAFGTVLYEMLSGNRAFRGDTSADVMMSLLNEEPAVLPAAERHIPTGLVRTVERCLEKNPGARFQSATDLAFALETLSSPSGETSASAAAISAKQRPWNLALAALAVIALAAASGIVASRSFRPPTVDATTTRFPLTMPAGWRLAMNPGGTSIAPLAVSPDGRHIAFLARPIDGNQPTMMWIRARESLELQMLAGTAGAASPFWSPDNRHLGFFVAGALRSIDVAGGPPVTLCVMQTLGIGGTWSQGGIILFAQGGVMEGSLMKVPETGGVPTEATALAEGDKAHLRPAFLPDGRHFLFRVVPHQQGAGGGIYLGSLDSPDRVRLLESDSTNALYAQGHIFFLRESTLMAQPFDAGRLTLGGDPFPVADRIQTLALNPAGIYSVSESGVLAYQTNRGLTGSELLWLDRSGKRVGKLGDTGEYSDLRLSSDGRFLAISKREPTQNRDATGGPTARRSTLDVWLFELATGNPTRFTFHPDDDSAAVLSPDGSQAVFSSRRKGHFDLFQKPTNGSAAERELLVDANDKNAESWSPDGRHLTFLSRAERGSRRRMWVLPLFGDRKVFPLTDGSGDDTSGTFSPDGRWVAYVSNSTGRNEVYVLPFPPTGAQWQVSESGGDLPRWRGDGKEIFYVSGIEGTADATMMARTVNQDGSAIRVLETSTLFTFRPVPLGSSYDVSHDGQRFVINTRASLTPGDVEPPTVVIDWLAAFNRK